MADPIKISIVISNYNYGRFLPKCLESVRAQTYPHVECIVVDDGSTDDSGEVIARYPEFRSIFKANAGQAKALETGFAASTGNVVVFLDSDDFLFPDACADIALLWEPDLVSLHYRLQIFENDVPTGRTWPDDRFREGREQIDCLFQLGYVPAAPTSGNAYARGYVAWMFDEVAGLSLQWLDICFAYAAPVAGRTRHSERALGGYRIHGSNLTGWTQRRTVKHMKKGLLHAFHAQDIARRLAQRQNLPVPRWDFLAGSYELKFYLLTRGGRRVEMELPRRSPLACATQSARAFLVMRGSWFRKVANVALVFAFAAAPLPCRRIIAERFYKLDFAG